MNSGFGSNHNPNKGGAWDFLTDPDKGLGRYFNIASPQDLIALLLTGVDRQGNAIAKIDASETKGIDETVRNLLINVTRDCLTTPNLINTLKQNLESAAREVGVSDDNIKTQFRSIIQINAGPDIRDDGLGSKESLNEMLAMPLTEANGNSSSEKNTPTMSSIMIFPVGISPAVKNTAGLSLFFNSIPPIEFARAVPFLEVNVQLNRPPTNSEGKLNAPSLLKFIMGAQKPETTADLSITEGYRQKVKPDGTYTYDEESESTIIGMEAFLMPQTLTPFGSRGSYSEMNADTVRAMPIADPFRPLMSIQGLDIKVVNSTGIGSYKNATMTLIIHDRTRLVEVADFIKPDLYSRTQLMIEYGWRHPDTDPEINPWGAFINTLRCREKYGVTNSSFNMEENGQITVTLDLHMLGGLEYNMTKITETPEINTALKKIQEIQKRIQELLETVAKKSKDGKINSKSVFASQIFESATSLDGTSDFKKLHKQYKTTRSKLDSSDSQLAKKMIQQLDALFDDTNGAEIQFRNTLDASLKRKYAIISGNDKATKEDNDDPADLISAATDDYSEDNVDPEALPPLIADDAQVWVQTPDFVGNVANKEVNQVIAGFDPGEVQVVSVSYAASQTENVPAVYSNFSNALDRWTAVQKQKKKNKKRKNAGGAAAGGAAAGGAAAGGAAAGGGDVSKPIQINYDRSRLIDVYDKKSVSLVKNPGPPEVIGEDTKNTVTFGKLFMLFVAQPMLSTGEFDDIQVLFYASNSGAGDHRNLNIASFPIENDKFKKTLTDAAQKKRTPHFSLGEFIALMSSNFFDNQLSSGYGLSNYYTSDKDGNVVLKKKTKNIEGKEVSGQDAVGEALTQYLEVKLNIEGGIFRPIQLCVIIEALPESTPLGTEGQTTDNFEKKTILRIHVYDKTSSAYTSEVELLNAAKADELNKVTFSQIDDAGNETQIDKIRAVDVIVKAEQLGLIERAGEDTINVPGASVPVYKNYTIKGGHKAIKEFVMSSVPYIIYGAQNTLIESLGLSSMQMPELSTVNILRAPSTGFITPTGQGQGGVPLKVVPVQMSVSMLGCPIISFMQQVFIDAGTGTDIDNVYAVTDLNHKFEPGSFKTTMGMTPQHAYAKYESLANKLQKQLASLNEINEA